MSTDLPEAEILTFYDFLRQRVEGGDTSISPEQSVQEFRLYQRELQKFIEDTQPALDQAARGESKPLDVGALMDRVRHRLAANEASG